MRYGSRFVHWWLPSGATQVFTPPVTPFGVAKFNDAGLDVLMLLHIIAGRDANTIYRASPIVGSLGPGSIPRIGTSNITANRVQIETTGAHVVLNQSGGDAFSTLFGPGGTYETASVYARQEGSTDRLVLPPAQLDTAGAGFVRWDVPSGDRSIIANIAAGDELLLALALTA